MIIDIQILPYEFKDVPFQKSKNFEKYKRN